MSRVVLILLLAIFCLNDRVLADDHGKIPFDGEDGKYLPKRLALVIGVNNYKTLLAPLAGPHNDVKNVAEFLTGVGYDVKSLAKSDKNEFVVRDSIDAHLSDLAARARKVRADAKRGAIVVFYFSGHGLRYDGKNYLLPSDFAIEGAEDIPKKAISVDSIALKLAGRKATDGQAELVIIVTDACRTKFPSFEDPKLEASFNKLELPSAAFQGGEGHVVFVYSTLNNAAAFENSGDGGVFTKELVSALNSALEEVKADPKAPVKRMLHDIVLEVKSNMLTSVESKNQIPDIDVQWANPFQPFPTYFDYQLEKSTLERLGANDVKGSITSAFDDYVCNLRAFLTAFTWYSYFSWDLIQEIEARKRIPRKWECNRKANRIRRENNVWTPPSPPTPGPISQSQPKDGRLQRAHFASLSDTFVLAQISQEAASVSDAETDPLARLTFGDLQKAFETIPFDKRPQRLPPLNVQLRNAVVTKDPVNIRSAPGAHNRAVGAAAAGEYLEVVGTSPGRTWLEIRYPGGTGFIGGETVEPAIVSITKTVSFAPKQYELNDVQKTEIAAAFAMLGGVVVVDSAVEFSELDGRLGLVRAAALQEFFGSLIVPTSESRFRPIIALKSRKAAEIPTNQTRITVLALPLNSEVRATIDKFKGSISVTADPNLSTAKICASPTSSNCQSSPGAAATGAEAVSKQELEEVIKTIRPLDRPPSLDFVTDPIKKLKILRF